jgi:Ras-related protein Rab-8A
MKILVANKIDLPNRVIEAERGEQLAKEYGLHFFETSARTGANINELF